MRLASQPGAGEGNMGIVQPGPRVTVGGQATVIVVATPRRRTSVATSLLRVGSSRSQQVAPFLD